MIASRKKYLILLIMMLLFVICNLSFAQLSAITGIKLMDDTVIYGKILNMNVEIVRMETTDGRIISKKFEDIKEFLKGDQKVAVAADDKPDDVPPRIVVNADQVRIWDRPDAFGPVPSDLQESGRKVCGPLGMKAIGYHSQARDENGKVFDGGGYLCVTDEH